MTEARVETGVDRLLEFLKGKNKMPLKEVAKNLDVSENILQLWVDFLVEERILGVVIGFC